MKKAAPLGAAFLPYRKGYPEAQFALVSGFGVCCRVGVPVEAVCVSRDTL